MNRAHVSIRVNGYIRKMPNRGSATGALKAAGQAERQRLPRVRPDPGSRRPRAARWSSRESPRRSYLSRIGCADGRFFLGGQRLAFAGELIALDRREHAGRLLAAHDRDAAVGPHPQEPRLVGAAAHAVVAGAERAADDDGELRHDRVRDGVHHLGAVLGDAGALVLRARR